MQDFDFIDLHFHANPDLYIRRNNYEKTNAEYNLQNGAVLIHNHLGYTDKTDDFSNIFDSLTLNNITGGVDYKIIDKVIKKRNNSNRKLLVLLPTITNNSHKSVLKRQVADFVNDTFFQSEIIAENGKLLSKTKDVIKYAKDNTILLATGHSSKEEVYLIIEESQKIGLNKLLISQPSNPITGILGQEMLILSQKFDFLWFEQTALTVLLKYETFENFEFVVKNINNLIYSSDLGQTSQLEVKTWLQTSKEWFSKMDLTKKRINQIMKQNPYNLITK